MLLSFATLEDIIEKFKCLYGSVEFLKPLMQEFYRNCTGKTEKVQTFILWLVRALKAIKQQHPHTMAEEEGNKHLKDCLFHGVKPNIHNALSLHV